VAFDDRRNRRIFCNGVHSSHAGRVIQRADMKPQSTVAHHAAFLIEMAVTRPSTGSARSGRFRGEVSWRHVIGADARRTPNEATDGRFVPTRRLWSAHSAIRNEAVGNFR